MTHNERVLALLSDGQPHSHLEMYDLHVIAHSRVSDLRKKGHTINCWLEDGLHWYQLLGEGHLNVDFTPDVPPPVPLSEQPDGQLCIGAAA